MRHVLERAFELNQTLTVPADVVGEWWRGRTDVREDILASVDVEPLTAGLAKPAGEALAVVKGATPVDAIVNGVGGFSGGCRVHERPRGSSEVERSFPRRAVAVRLSRGTRFVATRHAFCLNTSRPRHGWVTDLPNCLLANAEALRFDGELRKL